MNSYATLIFPDIDIFSERHSPLLLFFSPLHFLQLMEPGAGARSEASHDADIFLKSGLCQAHIPAPLGDDRQQFLRLITDIRKHKEQYIAQFKAMTSPAETRTAGRKQGIVSSLLREYGVKHQTTEADLELWQARLVLAIAEMLDSDEESLREQLSEQLAFLNEEEIAAFRAQQEAEGVEGVEGVHGEDPFEVLADLKAQLETPRLSDIEKRFEAWLCLLKNQPPPLVKVWLASTRDSADQIFTKYESASKMRAIPLLKLALPAYIEASGKYVVQQIEEFQQGTRLIHQGLVADFERIVKTVPYEHDSHESLLPYGTDWAELWEGMVDEKFPASRYGRNDIIFYLLPDQPLAQVLSLPGSVGAAPDQAAHGLLGVLVPRAV